MTDQLLRTDVQQLRDEMRELRGDVRELRGDVRDMSGAVREMSGALGRFCGDLEDMLERRPCVVTRTADLRDEPTHETLPPAPLPPEVTQPIPASVLPVSTAPIVTDHGRDEQATMGGALLGISREIGATVRAHPVSASAVWLLTIAMVAGGATVASQVAAIITDRVPVVAPAVVPVPTEPAPEPAGRWGLTPEAG